MPRPKQVVSASDARGADIVLRRRPERIVFIAGLCAALIVALVAVALEMPGW